jgi:hypothetical protein
MSGKEPVRWGGGGGRAEAEPCLSGTTATAPIVTGTTGGRDMLVQLRSLGNPAVPRSSLSSKPSTSAQSCASTAAPCRAIAPRAARGDNYIQTICDWIALESGSICRTKSAVNPSVGCPSCSTSKSRYAGLKQVIYSVRARQHAPLRRAPVSCSSCEPHGWRLTPCHNNATRQRWQHRGSKSQRHARSM